MYTYMYTYICVCMHMYLFMCSICLGALAIAPLIRCGRGCRLHWRQRLQGDEVVVEDWSSPCHAHGPLRLGVVHGHLRAGGSATP